jgi:hypothetical protein
MHFAIFLYVEIDVRISFVFNNFSINIFNQKLKMVKAKNCEDSLYPNYQSNYNY